jgi:hypothetical protein
MSISHDQKREERKVAMLSSKVLERGESHKRSTHFYHIIHTHTLLDLVV